MRFIRNLTALLADGGWQDAVAWLLFGTITATMYIGMIALCAK